MKKINPYIIAFIVGCCFLCSGFTMQLQAQITISGQVFIDENTNCVQDSLDVPAPNLLVKIEDVISGVADYVSADANGQYTFNGQVGSAYILEAIMPNSNYTNNCSTIVTNSIDSDANIDIPVAQGEPCPYLTVDLSSPILRPCENNNYSITYCNRGTLPAFDVKLALTLDEAMSLPTSATTTEVDSVPNLYEYIIGNLAADTCITFDLGIALSCDIIPGSRHHCVEAEITGNPVCLSNDSFSVNTSDLFEIPFVDLSAKCITDTAEGEFIEFKIKNIGSDNMPDSLEYRIYEDHVIVDISKFKLAIDSTLTINYQSLDARIIRLEAQQFPVEGLPSYDPRVLVENCGFNQENTPQYNDEAVSVLEDDIPPNISIDCQLSVGPTQAYWRNNSVVPAGVWEENYINATDPLEYKIYFQNTTGELLYDVVVRDTLSPHLDISKIELGASSHPYEFAVKQGRILEWRFDQILLPDSNEEEVNSHAFFKFKVPQIVENPLGTVIQNTAIIQFSFTDSLITETTFNTIGENFFLDSTINIIPDRNRHQDGIANLYPNPLQGNNTLIMEWQHPNIHDFETLHFQLYNLLGQAIMQIPIRNNVPFSLAENRLGGIYFYRITTDKGLAKSGKLLIKK